MHNSYILFIELMGTVTSLAVPNNDVCFFRKSQLVKLKTKAMRSGVWFKVIERKDRALFNLSINVVGNVRSAKLAKSLVMLTRKLNNATRSNFPNRLVRLGLVFVQKTSLTAQKLGNASAKRWASDSSFVFFLAVMNFNVVRYGKGRVSI